MKDKLIPKGIMLPFILLTALFFAWALPNNLTDTMLAAFKRIMSLSDSQTAWIQVVCYLFGYGLCSLPGALFIKRYGYKSGVILGLALYALGAFVFYPAMMASQVNMGVSFVVYLLAIFILFAGLAVLETSANSYVYAIGSEKTATRRLNFAQSFNPFGAISGVVIAQVFILSELNTLTAEDRAAMPAEQLFDVQFAELYEVTSTYVIVGLIMFALLLAILFTKMPKIKEDNTQIDLKGSLYRLSKNKNYVWAVIAQFFYVGAQIAVWSFTIRYTMNHLQFNDVIARLGENASPYQIIDALRGIEPLAASFYQAVESVGLTGLLPRTAEQAGATYYILSLILLVIMRLVGTYLMRFFSPRSILSILAILAFVLTIMVIYCQGVLGVYALVAISGCMSIMFPTIFGLGVTKLGDDTKIGGSGMVMGLAGAAILTQIQGIVSDNSGSIEQAYWVPAIAFLIVAYYAIFIAKTPTSNEQN